MDSKDYINIVTNSTTTAEKRDEFWHVTQIVTQKRSKDGENWEEKELSMSASDRNLDIAFKQTIMSIAVYLGSIGGDLFYDDLEDDFIDEELTEEDFATLPESKYVQ